MFVQTPTVRCHDSCAVASPGRSEAIDPQSRNRHPCPHDRQRRERNNYGQTKKNPFSLIEKSISSARSCIRMAPDQQRRYIVTDSSALNRLSSRPLWPTRTCLADELSTKCAIVLGNGGGAGQNKRPPLVVQSTDSDLKRLSLPGFVLLTE